MKTKSVKKYTAPDIVAALHKRYPAPEYAAFQEVANGTGANARRWIDVLVMAIWPSRGLQVIGIEIKVSKADWKRELADPKKADAIGKYCDLWWIATPPGIVDPETLPLNWGLMELGPHGFKVIKKAPKLKPEPLTKGFVASILRRAQENQEKVTTLVVRAARQKWLAEKKNQPPQFEDHTHRRTTEELTRVRQKISDFQTASGVDLGDWRGGTDIGKAVAKVLTMRTTAEPLRTLEREVQHLREAADHLDGNLAALRKTLPKPKAKA